MCVAAAVVGSAAIGAVSSGIASNNAADAQRDAARSSENVNQASLAEQRRVFDLQREDQRPYREAGYFGLNQLRSGLASGGQFARDFSLRDFNADPGYQFRVSEGEKAIQRGASARGMNLSGATLKALNRFNSGNAAQEYGAAYDRYNNNQTNRFNRFASLAGIGQTANQQGASAAQNFGTAVQNGAAATSGNLAAIGNATAANYINQGNNISNTANGLAGNYLTYRYLTAK